MKDCTWIVGYSISVIGGIFAVPIFLYLMRLVSLRCPRGFCETFEPTAVVTGIIERFIATTLYIYGAHAVEVFIGGWMALKLAANWQRVPFISERHGDEVRTSTIISLLGNAISFIFAIGGAYFIVGLPK
jgi:hypothetical protein